ncbi:MAG: Hpt domain-containing protein, partial [Oceanococcaceae bacterium]
MSEDRELLEDFLVEAGELTSGLGPALMALESDEDGQAINALFRTFHTLKGSAGFLGLDAIVKLCHAAEDLCSLLRGDAEPTADDIDALSAAIDILEEQMQALQDGADIPIAPAKVLSALKLCVATDREQGSAASEPEEIDFEALLDAMHGVPEPAAPAEPEVPTEAVAEEEADDTQSEEQAEPDAEPAAAAEPDEAAPAAEPAVAKAKAPVAESSIRVETQRLDTVMDLVGELVLVRNALLAAGQRDKSVATLDRVTADLQSAVMRIRMQPLTKLFSRFPRIVRDLARGLGKEIDLQLVGAETELD